MNNTVAIEMADLSKTSEPLREQYKGIIEFFNDTQLDKNLRFMEKLQYNASHGNAALNAKVLTTMSMSSSARNAIKNQQNKSAYEITKVLKNKTQKYLKSLPESDLIPTGEITSIISSISEAIRSVVSDLIPIKNDLSAIIKHSKKAIDKYLLLYSTKDLKKIATNQSAADIIEQIRREILKSALSSTANLVASAGVMTIHILSAGVGAIVTTAAKAIVAIFQYIKMNIDKILLIRKFDRFKISCQTMQGRMNSLTNSQFESWFKAEISRLPLLACYIVCTPRFGHYLEFLKILSAEIPPKGFLMKTERKAKKIKKFFYNDKTALLEHDTYVRNSIIESFESLKVEAREYIKSSHYKLTSTKVETYKVLRMARGDNIVADASETNIEQWKSAVIDAEREQGKLRGEQLLGKKYGIGSKVGGGIGSIKGWVLSLTES